MISIEWFRSYYFVFVMHKFLIWLNIVLVLNQYPDYYYYFFNKSLLWVSILLYMNVCFSLGFSSCLLTIRTETPIFTLERIIVIKKKYICLKINSQHNNIVYKGRCIIVMTESLSSMTKIGRMVIILQSVRQVVAN